MTSLEVCSVVDSILEAFKNGMDIFGRMKGRRSKKRRNPPKMNPEELRLHDSLSNRPKEIKAEYAQSVMKHGKRFEQGDNTAYSSLAHTLLVLNTGLINLINDALSSDAVVKSKSRQSLLFLSESAAATTMHALSQLSTRLSGWSNIDPQAGQRRNQGQPTKLLLGATPATRPPPSPLLVRGGWVRSRSGSSVISAATAKKLAIQSGEHQRSKSSSTSSSTAVSRSASDLPDKLLEFSLRESTSLFPSTPETTEEEWASRTPHKGAAPAVKRHPSMLLVPADYFTSPSVVRDEPLVPPRPPKIPLHARPNPRSRPRPSSTATFMTASTRIGEIPEHKWAGRCLSEEEHEHLPLPYVIPPPLEAPKLKSKSRRFRFWKRPE